ncbi:MAG: hypothetical protein ACK4RS_02550 [Thiothrix sp.]
MSKLKQLINPPIQAILLGSSAALLSFAAWQIVQLKLQDADSQLQASAISVQIPDAASLATPSINAYTQSVETPLFWESRRAVKVAETLPEPVLAPSVDTSLPDGRLVGIIDNAGTLFAVMSNAAGESVRLHRGDNWGAWQVVGIDPQRLILALGEQRQEIPLVADFAAPQESPQVVQAKAQQQLEQQARQQAMALAAQQATNVPRAVPANTPPPGLPFPTDTQQQPPALSVEDALAARQRLMAARWGALTGEQPAAEQGQAPAGQ